MNGWSLEFDVVIDQRIGEIEAKDAQTALTLRIVSDRASFLSIAKWRNRSRGCAGWLDCTDDMILSI
jgi:hypothetical protein